MMKYEDLLGRTFKHGEKDCYAILRAAYKNNFGIELTDYARPDSWWENGMNLYIENFYNEGFRLVEEPIQKIKEGDVLLCAIRSTVANHCGVYVGDCEKPILHHYYNRFSETVPFSGIFRNAVVAHIRHKDVVPKQITEQVDFLDLLPPLKRRQVEAAIAAGTVSR